MKKILITGANSYIGMSFEKYLNDNYPNDYIVDTVDMIDNSWREKNFSGYDSVFHVAGIAHQKETKENAPVYYKVNCDLAVETAEKAKRDGVKQFIILSSMSVYGMDTGVITKETVPDPKSNYGKSKLKAEEGINNLADSNFVVAILRPPMVYGKNCKGNFQTVLKLVRKLPVFPYVKNERSMIYIDNLCSFVKLLVDEGHGGCFFPQNNNYLQTTRMAECMAEVIGKKLFLSRLIGFGIALIRPFITTVQKAFGSLVYKDTEVFDYRYCVIDNEESVRRSV